MGLGTHPSARLAAAQLAALAALISDCARPTAETALLTAMAALLSRRCAISPRCCPALSFCYAPNGETPNPREEQILARASLSIEPGGPRLCLERPAAQKLVRSVAAAPFACGNPIMCLGHEVSLKIQQWIAAGPS